MNYIWTGNEGFRDFYQIFRISGPDHIEEEEYRQREAVIVWDCLLSLSRTCSTLRKLCLPRMYGTLMLGTCKMIGQKIWRSLQANPSLGAYTHTCYVEYRPHLWPNPMIPSEAIDRLLIARDMAPAIEELKVSKPGRIGYDEERQLNSYSSTGPDGKGFDANITSPEEFKLALEEIFASLSKICELYWKNDLVSFYSSIIKGMLRDAESSSSSNGRSASRERALPRDSRGVEQKVRQQGEMKKGGEFESE